ncbi:DUF5937 family protein [Amycolatopsis sp. NPDC051128]|uniref:ArsR/SmtB family transcription factor n=1 Tax=Amycolatopsis sp. NPDC051128 TaxID=3155412 RepID=UPI00342ADA30
MITLRADAGTMARVRFSFSPAQEVMAWLKLTAKGDRHPVFGDPGPSARAALAHPDVELVSDLLPPDGATYVPDLLTPRPGAGGSCGELFDEQLAAVESTSQDDLESQVCASISTYWGRPAPVAVQRRMEAGDLPKRLAAGLGRFWREALADSWPALQPVIDRDIADRAAVLVSFGLGRLLNSVHPGIAWTGDAVTIDKPWTGEIDVTGRELVLAPGVLGGPSLLVQVDKPDEVVLYVPVRKAGAGTRRHCGRLAAVIGETRAILLDELEGARSTTDLARRLGYAPGTISYHLGAMHRVGLVTKRREGRQVLYTRTSQAQALLSE